MIAMALAVAVGACGSADGDRSAAEAAIASTTGAGDTTAATGGAIADDDGTTPGTATSLGPPVAAEPSTSPGDEATGTTSPEAGNGTVGTRPDWLGTRVLPTMPDGVVPPQTTPPELVDRRFATIDILPPPPDGAFASTVEPLTDEIVERSTWNEDCPVTVDELRYVTVSFWGFDDLPHTGELILHETVVDDIVSVFTSLYEARFPIEEMRITTAAELDAPPTGDGNNTAAFVCRAVVGGTRFSEHAFGLAVDINPFHNPYRRGDVVLPELAGVYLDRDDVRPGMIVEGDVVVAAFDRIGWGWGGRWQSLDDYHHFSLHNR